MLNEIHLNKKRRRSMVEELVTNIGTGSIGSSTTPDDQVTTFPGCPIFTVLILLILLTAGGKAFSPDDHMLQGSLR